MSVSQTSNVEGGNCVVAALYKFVRLNDYVERKPELLATCQAHDIKGTLLLAQEGINGTIAGSREGIDAVLAYLKADDCFEDLDHKESFCDENPFLRMKVKLKKEIVTLGVEGISPTKQVGQYVEPKDWNDLISEPDVVVVDTRNDYEYEIGTFKGAVDPQTTTFREFPQYVEENLDPKKHKKVAMFCTGGIRCEKSTSYMLEQGFDEVYHLQGGILKYLETVPEDESLWEGECFVFDERVAVKHNLEVGQYDQCHACRFPITEEEKQSEHYIVGVSCPKCVGKTTPEQRERFAERQRQIDLAQARGQSHLAGSLEEAKAEKAKRLAAQRERSRQENAKRV